MAYGICIPSPRDHPGAELSIKKREERGFYLYSVRFLTIVLETSLYVMHNAEDAENKSPGTFPYQKERIFFISCPFFLIFGNSHLILNLNNSKMNDASASSSGGRNSILVILILLSCSQEFSIVMVILVARLAPLLAGYSLKKEPRNIKY